MTRGLRISRLRNLRLTTIAGVFQMAGQSANLTKARNLTMTVLPGIFQMSGYAVSFSRQTRLLQATHGSFTMTGNLVNLVKSGSTGPVVANFTLETETGSGTYPFTLAYPFKRGDIPAGPGGCVVTGTGLVAYRVKILRHWNDGSVKHAMIVGRAAVTTTPATFSIASGTSPADSAPLTTSSITALGLGTCSITVAGQGAAAVFNLASPLRTRHSNDEMVENNYRVVLPGNNQFYAGLDFRLFKDGRWAVCPFLEYGTLDNGSGAKPSQPDVSAVVTVVINGVTIYNNAGAALLHTRAQRWCVPAPNGWDIWTWGGGTDPRVVPMHNKAYLLATEQVPMYDSTLVPDAATISGLDVTYQPLNNGPINADMGDTGEQTQIGPLQKWDAIYCVSGAKNAKKAVIVGSSSLNSYAIVWRNFTTRTTTGNPFKLSALGNWTLDGPNAGGNTSVGVTAGYIWDHAHHPGNYLAYLLTGDTWHYETMWFNATTAYLHITSAAGFDVNRDMAGSPGNATPQTRGYHWIMRTLGLFSSIMPDAEITGDAGEYKTLLENNYALAAGRIYDGRTDRWVGIPFYRELGLWQTGGADFPFWQHHFGEMSQGMLWDMECTGAGTPRNNHRKVRNWMYQASVMLLGESGVSHDHPFTHASGYGKIVSPDGTNWYQKPGDIFAANNGGVYNTTVLNTLTGAGGNDPNNWALDNYWAILYAAVAYAVQHKARGAINAFRRLTGATNFSTGYALTNNTCKWSMKPRRQYIPSYVGSLSTVPGSTKLIGSNTASAVRPSAYPDQSYFDQATWKPYGGGRLIRRYSQSGAYVLSNTGGHNNYNFPGALIWDVLTQTWSRLDNANGTGYANWNVFTDITTMTNGLPYIEMAVPGFASVVEMPSPSHTVAEMQELDESDDYASIMSVTRMSADSTGNAGSQTVHKQRLDSGLWQRAVTGSMQNGVQIGGSTAYDPCTHRYYVTDSQFWDNGAGGPGVLAYVRGSDMTAQALTMQAGPSGTNYCNMFILPQRRIMLMFDSAGTLFGMDLLAATYSWVVLTTSGPKPTNGYNGWEYHEREGKFYHKDDVVGNTYYTLTPPAGTGMSGTWVYAQRTATGDGLPDRNVDQGYTQTQHHTCFPYSDALDRILWFAGGTQQVAALVGGVPVPKTYTTTFPFTQNPLSESGVWTNGHTTGIDWTDVQSGSGVAFRTQVSQAPGVFDDSMACLSGFSPNHSVQTTLSASSPTGELECEILLRWSIAAHTATGYEISVVDTGNLYLVRLNGTRGNYSIIDGPISVPNSNNTVFNAQILGGVITVKANGTTVLTRDVQAWAVANGGAYYTTGNPGIGFYTDTSLGAASAGTTFAWADFTATDI